MKLLSDFVKQFVLYSRSFSLSAKFLFVRVKKRTHLVIDYEFVESRKFGRIRSGSDAKFKSSLNSRRQPGEAACSSASEAVRGCEAEGREEKGCEEEGGDEGRRTKREGLPRIAARLSLTCVVSVSRSASFFFSSLVMTSLISHIIRYDRH